MVWKKLPEKSLYTGFISFHIISVDDLDWRSIFGTLLKYVLQALKDVFSTVIRSNF
jgi:hypothetical protein